jgi:hypothetical protein
MHGPVLTATVDSSFASYADLKGQSCYTIHMGGGGACIVHTKKQTVTPFSSTESEIDGNALLWPTLKWSRNFMEELGYNQSHYIPNGTPVGEDNTSCMKILQNSVNSGKTKHMNLRIQVLREAIAQRDIQLFHLPTTDMVSDIGTKALAPGIFQHLSDYLLGHTQLPDFLPFLTDINYKPVLSFLDSTPV